jgi:hypothetical protein
MAVLNPKGNDRNIPVHNLCIFLFFFYYMSTQEERGIILHYLCINSV